MKTQEFLTELRDALEFEEVELTPDTDLKGIKSYDSLSILTIIAFVDDKFKKKLTAVQLASIGTVRSLMELIGPEHFDGFAPTEARDIVPEQSVTAAENGKTRKHIVEKISAIKKRPPRTPAYANFYFHPFDEEAVAVLEGDGTIVFVLADANLFRLFFYSKDIGELERMIESVEYRPVVIDHISSSMPRELEEVFLGCGFESYAKMVHMTNPELPLFEKFEAIGYADESDESEIRARLFQWLDEYTGHFPDRNALISSIRAKHVLVEKKAGRTIGLYIFKIKGVTGDLFQWGFSRDPDDYDPDLALRLNTNALALLREQGARRAVLWANETNAKVIKIHTLNGFRKDGLYDHIYLKRRAS